MTVTWERNVSEVVWESQTAPGITWTTVVGGTVTGGESVLERTTTNDGENVLLASVNGVDGTDGVVVIGPRGYRLDAEGGPGFLPLTVDPRSGAGVQAPLNTLSTGPAGPLRKTGSAATAWSEIASGGTTVRRADAVALLMTSSPSGLSVTVSYGEDYGSFTATVANSATVIALNIADGGELQLWTAHSGAWTAGSTAGWAVGDRVQVLEADGDGFGGVLGDSPFGPGLLIPVWDNEELMGQRAQALVDAADATVRADTVQRALLVPEITHMSIGLGTRASAWISDLTVPSPSSSFDIIHVETIIDLDPAILAADPLAHTYFHEVFTQEAETDVGITSWDVLEIARLDVGPDPDFDSPVAGRLYGFTEISDTTATSETEETARVVGDTGSRKMVPLFGRTTWDATTSTLRLWEAVVEGGDQWAHGVSWKVMQTYTGAGAGSFLVRNRPWLIGKDLHGGIAQVTMWVDVDLSDPSTYDNDAGDDWDHRAVDWHAEDFVGETSGIDRAGVAWETDTGGIQPYRPLPTPAEIGAQPLDSDLTAIAALDPADGRFLRRLAGAWDTSTPSEVKADLSIGHADVSGFDEQARDVLGAALTNGTGITITVNDGANTITIAVDAAAARTLLGQTWQQIADTTLGSAAASMSATITGYRAIRFRFSGRSERTLSANDQLLARFNSDSGPSNYSTQASALASALSLGSITSSATNTDRIAQIVGELSLGSSSYTIGHSITATMNSTASTVTSASTASQMWNGSISNAPTSFSIFTNSGSNLAAGSRLIIEGLI